MRLLCAGDLHLGRRSSRLPEEVDPRGISSAECWLALVELALARDVHAVLLSGDIVDRANRYFEAFGPLETGLRRLTDAGIRTFVVAGNHDFDVLPRLVDSFPLGSVRLLGRGGLWERATLEVEGRPVLHVDGWSFPSEHVRSDPVAEYRPEPSELPVVGLLHCDLDQPASRYAPTASASLRARPIALWVLGHVHQPSLTQRAGTVPLLYPGSPQALDPGEPGVHGAWFLEVARTGTTCTSVALSSVRYDTVEIELDGEAAPEVEALVAERVRSHLDEVRVNTSRLTHLSLRIRLTGRVGDRREVEARVVQLARDLRPTSGRTAAYVERVDVDTRPAVDLVALADGSDPPAVLARFLLGLESGTPEAGRLIRTAESRATEVRRARPYLQLGLVGGDPGSGTKAVPTAVLLRRQAYRLLDALLAQKEDGS